MTGAIKANLKYAVSMADCGIKLSFHIEYTSGNHDNMTTRPEAITELCEKEKSGLRFSQAELKCAVLETP